MILIIYDKSDKGTLDFINYLKHEKKDFYLIEASDLITNYTIYDDGKNIIWTNKLTSQKIDFSKISSIYNRLHDLNLTIFDDYDEEDRFYVKKEWESYLIYVMENCNSRTKPNLYLLSSLIMQYPFYFSLAENIGIKVPFYYISSDIKEVKTIFNKKEHEYIIRPNIYHNTNFKISDEIKDDTYGIIEKPAGDMIVVDVIGEKIFSSKIKDKKPAPLSSQDNKKLLELARKLKLDFIQLLMIQNEEDIFLMYLSAYPNWLKYDDLTKENIYQEVVDFLR